MYKLLCSQFNQTQETLKDIEHNIKRLTGRDANSFGDRSANWKNDSLNRLRQNTFQNKKRPFNNQGITGPAIKPLDEDEGEDSGDDGKNKKPSIQSTIVSTAISRRIKKTRRDTLAEQKGDKKVLARNRRMFGVMLGTLQKFQSEESTRKRQEEKRAEIVKKVEEAAEKEKELIKKEREQLFVTRKESQIKIRCLEKKLEIAEMHDIWERNQKFLMNFIQTTAKPQIMFQPTKHNTKSKKCLAETKEKIAGVILERRTKIEKELLAIDECYDRKNAEMISDNIIDKSEFNQTEQDMLHDDIEKEEDEKDIHADAENANCVTDSNNTTLEPMDVDDQNSMVVEAAEEFEPIYD